MVIFLSLRYFYKERMKENMLQGNQRVVGVVILTISIIVAFVLMS
jgi:hypothetical protein